MRIAIPLVEGTVSMHFGHCEEFAFIDADMETGLIDPVERSAPPQHQPGVLPAWLADKGVDMVIAGGMGSRAQQLFAQHGIKVLVGADREAPEIIVRQFLDGTLNVGSNICDH